MIPLRNQIFDEQELTLEQIDALRDLRAEAQSLKLVLSNAKSGLHELKEYEEFIWQTYGDMGRLCVVLRDSNMRDADNPQKSKSDSLSSIINHWEYLVIAIPAILDAPVPDSIHSEWMAKWVVDRATETKVSAVKAPEPDAAETAHDEGSPKDPIPSQLRRLAAVDEALRYVVMMVGYLTIPDRINRWLGRNEAEDIVSFHRIFADELPDEADRIRVLGLLASSPKRIPLGIIDPVTGLIYRCPQPNSWAQIKLLLGIGISIGLSLAVLTAYLVMTYPDTTTWHPEWDLSHDAEVVLAAWLMLLGGMSAQRSIARRKRKDPMAAELRLTLTRWTRLAAAKATRIVETLALSVIALIIYHVSMRSGVPIDADASKTLSLSGAFFLGYGFDSALDLLSTELERRTPSTFGQLKLK